MQFNSRVCASALLFLVFLVSIPACAVEKLTPTSSTWLPSSLLGIGLAALGLVALIRPTLLPGIHGMGGEMQDKAPAMQATMK